MSSFKKIKIEIITQWRATLVSITHVSGFKKNNNNNYTVACHVSDWIGSGVFCGESLYYKGVLWRIFILEGWNLSFFFTGGKPELAQITGGKNILTGLKIIKMSL